MNSRLYQLIPVFIIAGLLSGCSKVICIEKKEENLKGSWQWLRTDGGIAFQIHDTPLSTGQLIELKMTADNKYYIYINGALTSEGTYSLETRKCIHGQTNKTFIDFSSTADQDMMVEVVDQESLELSDEAYDGIRSLYKRNQSVGN